jgi:hypothetical protein
LLMEMLNAYTIVRSMGLDNVRWGNVGVFPGAKKD